MLLLNLNWHCFKLLSIEKKAYVDFGSGLGIKEGFNSVPQQPESRTSIDDEHTVQRLSENKSWIEVTSEVEFYLNSKVESRWVSRWNSTSG